MEEKKDVFFVGMENPQEIRDSLMNAWKDIVESLERFEKFKEIREERAANIQKFRTDMRDIFKLITLLNSKLPKTGISYEISVKKETHHKHPEQKTLKPKEQKAKEPVKKTEKKKPGKSELDALESELDDIESKLDSLK